LSWVFKKTRASPIMAWPLLHFCRRFPGAELSLSGYFEELG
jgi:hypothetical protein